MATSSNWAASISINNLSDKAWWACALAKIVALVLVALAVVLVATAVSINSTLLAVLVVFASWLSNLWTLDVLACLETLDLSAAD